MEHQTLISAAAELDIIAKFAIIVPRMPSKPKPGKASQNLS